MPDLPHGWRMRNSEGEKVGPPVEEDGARFSGDESDEGDSDIDDVGGLDIRPDSEGWNDVEDDVEDVSIKCLLCDATFPGAKPMVQHCKEKHHFDFVAVQSQHNLDFYTSMKLVNYIRSEVLAGTPNPSVADPALWADDRYLRPAIEDDALLFSLDDIDERPVPGDETEEGAAQ